MYWLSHNNLYFFWLYLLLISHLIQFLTSLISNMFARCSCVISLYLVYPFLPPRIVFTSHKKDFGKQLHFCHISHSPNTPHPFNFLQSFFTQFSSLQGLSRSFHCPVLRPSHLINLGEPYLSLSLKEGYTFFVYFIEIAGETNQCVK